MAGPPRGQAGAPRVADAHLRRQHRRGRGSPWAAESFVRRLVYGCCMENHYWNRNCFCFVFALFELCELFALFELFELYVTCDTAACPSSSRAYHIVITTSIAHGTLRRV
jgi:hypothetical protein